MVYSKGTVVNVSVNSSNTVCISSPYKLAAPVTLTGVIVGYLQGNITGNTNYLVQTAPNTLGLSLVTVAPGNVTIQQVALAVPAPTAAQLAAGAAALAAQQQGKV